MKFAPLSFTFVISAGMITAAPPSLEKLDDPTYPALCPIDKASLRSGSKIPPEVLQSAHDTFSTNGGAVFTYDWKNEDIFDRTVEVTDNYVAQIESLGYTAFETPDYEFNPDANANVGPGPSGFRGCDVCSPPEPYPFRTVLPKIAMPRCAQTPYALFIPATYEDAASAINIIRDHNAQFTVLSGGHDYECQSGLPNGVVIITSLLNKLEVDYDEGTLTTGTGNLWQTIYDRLDKDEFNDGPNSEKRYGVMGAQCGFVSVAGFTLGGGLCWHMSKLHGMGSDSVIGMKVVTADGELVDAELDGDYQDLRWGMAGTGGMSMGLAVEFKYELKESKPDDYIMSRWEYRFFTEPSTKTGEYLIEDIPAIMHAWANAIDAIEDDDDYNTKIGSIRTRLVHQPGYGPSGGHRLQIRAMCSEGINLRDYDAFVAVVSEFPARSDKIEYYTSINDYVKTRRNKYPDSVDNPRVSSFIKGGGNAIQDALDIHLRFYLNTIDEEANRLVAGSDIDFYLLKGFIKNPERTSLNPDIADAKWHITSRAKHAYDQELEQKIRCKNREITRQLKDRLDDKWAGPYWNYFDSSVDKKDYYGDIFDDVKEIKEKYDPDNLFKKIKGIKVDDKKEIECLEDFCDGYEGYWQQWEDDSDSSDSLYVGVGILQWSIPVIGVLCKNL
uniref:FAD-binding PCMH-type domain-containing protein n=1 Tax=Helicotheca tamesis TaxID=374047 RepID=A0A7S2MEF3_9STRA|mmetsp:Transcript_14576/g.19926  ORF Transcript_14576/g.19926 Transcript_14576/m.19926 type:complete len:668 (+) Transcript_14576:30-2033(+)